MEQTSRASLPRKLAAAARQNLEPFLAASSLEERTDGFVDLVRWTRLDARHSEDIQAGELDPRARLEAVLSLLEGDLGLRSRFQAATADLLAQTDGTNLFAHVGIPSERGFPAELGERVMNHLLPRPRNDRDLANLMRRLFRREAYVARFTGIPDAAFARLLAVVRPEQPLALQAIRRSFADGFRLLAIWVQAQGLSPKIRKRSRPCALTASPFFRLAQASEAVLSAWAGGDLPQAEAAAWREECGRCREEMAEVHRRLERDGVSTHVVYGLEVLERCISRMTAMLEVMERSRDGESGRPLHRLLAGLAASVHRARSVRHLVSWTTHLLQRRIVERSSRTGEHYVATTPAEYREMALAAAGGGILTVGTAALKTVISSWPAPDFVHGLLYGLNYAVSFLLLQRLGLVLATKQPAMTGATLATIVRERRGEEREREIITFAARISSSQLAAVLGNVVMVSAGCVAFVRLWDLAFGRPFLAPEEAGAVFRDLSPVNSGTALYAALTGVILWLASVIGGWFDNSCAYHRLPQAIADHPAGRRLGRERFRRFGASLEANAAGWATSISLGFLLGITPALGHFLGLPLDVRHVTLNSGILSLATASLGERWFGEGMFLRGMAGVAVMFVLNLGVSFLLALLTAARAYELPASAVARLLGRLGREFAKSPGTFLLPPRREGEGGAPAAARH